VRVGSVDVYLFEEGEAGLILLLGEPAYLFIGTCLLIVKLVGREGQDLEAFVEEVIVELCEASVVFGGERSLGGHIDDQDGLLPSVNREVNMVAFDVLGRELKEGLGFLLVEVVGGLVVEAQSSHGSHLP